MKRDLRRVLPFLLAGMLVWLSGCALPSYAATPESPAAAAAKKAPASDCGLPACDQLVVTQDGRPGRAQSAASFALPAGQENSPWKIDTGVPSPDGSKVAYTSISSESGGPVFVQNVASGEWTNLIDAVNARLPEGQPPFALDYAWDVIGWFPKSDRLMIGPLDLSLVVVVDLSTYAAQPIPFPGGGRGGRMFVDLAPDGSRFIFIGDDSAGNQVMSQMHIDTGQVSELLRLPYEQGVLSNPRFSPDQASVAYTLQTGQPDPGLAYSIMLFSTQTGQVSQLVEDTQTMTAPLWSPDGRKIAYVRGEDAPSLAVGKDALPQDQRTNVWVITPADGQTAQATFADGFVRSPAWAADSQTLAFVMGDGQVNLASLDQPGQTWQAAAPIAVPELSSAFFLP